MTQSIALAQPITAQEVLQLRQKTGLPAIQMHELFQNFGENKELFLLGLEEAMLQAKPVHQELGPLMKQTEARLRKGDMHHNLYIIVPQSVDLEHAQAVLVYGYLAPGRSRIIAGNSYIALCSVKENVSNKLSGRFNHKKFNAAIGYLSASGVLLRATGTKRSDEARGFNLHENAPEVTPEGRDIIRLCMQFLRSSVDES